MSKIRPVILLLVVMCMFASVVQAQDESPVLRLFSEDVGHTFHVTTGTVIEVRLSFSELYVSYDPTRLQFLDYTLPAGLTGTVESGVIEPEGFAPGNPGMQTGDAGGSQPGTILPNQGQPELQPGSVGEPGVPPTAIPPESPSREGGSAVGVVTAVPGGVITPGSGGPDSEESYTSWRFLAIGSGQTSLELLTFRPPCSMGEPCMMMPDFLASFDLVIEGNTIVPEPETINPEVIVVRPQAIEPTLNVTPGQVVLFDVSGLEPPFHVIYHPGAVRLLTGENLRFLVNPWGMMTRVGVQTSNDERFAATLVIEPACEACGALPMPAPGQ